MTPPALETPRLRLRAHRAEDLEACAAMWADPLVVRHIGGAAFTRAQSWAKILAYAGLWRLLGYGYWAVEEKASGRFAGELGLADFKRDLEPSLEGVPELGWAFASAFHGRGYATEAVGAAAGWADRALGAPRVACLISPANAASLRVAEKCGFGKPRRARLRGEETLLLFRGRKARGPSGRARAGVPGKEKP